MVISILFNLSGDLLENHLRVVRGDAGCAEQAVYLVIPK